MINIYAKPGTKVQFLGENGHDYQLKDAMQLFEVGDVLTVRQTDVESSCSSVTFEETPGKWFNTVMFEEIYQHGNDVRDALSLLRTARNNMPKAAFLDLVRKYTEDANVAIPLLEASTVVSYERIVRNAKENI